MELKEIKKLATLFT